MTPSNVCELNFLGCGVSPRVTACSRRPTTSLSSVKTKLIDPEVSRGVAIVVLMGVLEVLARDETGVLDGYLGEVF